MNKDWNYDNKEIIVSVSGGKDSTAMCLNLLEQGYSKSDFKRVFADTGWESAETYRYLKEIEPVIGEITWIRNEDIKVREEDIDFLKTIEDMIGYSPMVRSILKNKIFPSGKMKYCTRILKMEAFNKFFEQLESDYVNLSGIRREESENRKDALEWEWNDGFDCWVHRPLVDWKESDVIAIHQRFGLAPNKLYFEGASRVGCFPCIKANKAQIALLTDKRIAVIKMLEEYISQKRGKESTFFRARELKSGRFANIEDVVFWANDLHIERDQQEQLYLFEKVESKHCEKWGMCGS